MQVAFVILTAEGLEGALAIRRLVHRGTGKADKGSIGQASHKEVAEIAAGSAVRFVDENVDVRANIDIGRHIAELVDHRHNNAPVVVAQQLVEPGDAASVLQIAQTECGEVLEHLVFQLVAVDHQEDGWLVGFGCTEELFSHLDHGEGFTAPLGVPDKAPFTHGIEGAGDGRLHRAGLMLAKDVFVQLLVLLGKDDVLLQEGQNEVALPPLLVIEELATIAQVLHEFPVAVEVGMEEAKLPEQNTAEWFYSSNRIPLRP